MCPPLAPPLKASTSGAVPQGQGPLADTPATVKVGSESAAADTSGELGANGYSMKNAALAEIKFPLCDAAVQKIDSGDWDLADAIVAECSETGDDGVRNESYAMMKAMRARDRQKPRRRTVVRANPKAEESRLGFSTRSPATGCFA